MESRVNCCTDAFLRKVLTTKHLLALDDVSWEHLVACSACKYRLLRLQEQMKNELDQKLPSVEGGVVLREIGSGAGGRVWLFLNQSDGLAFEAIKVLQQSSREDSHTKVENTDLCFQEERERLARLDGSGAVVSYKRKGWTTDDQQPWIAMTFIRGASSSVFAQHFKLSLSQRIRLARDICQLIETIHRWGVVHCDLKPGNVVVSPRSFSRLANNDSLKWSVRLIDFGCSCDRYETVNGRSTRTYLSHVAGTPGYICPELLDACKVGKTIQASVAIDIYSLGIMLFELVTGRLPRPGNHKETVRHNLPSEPTSKVGRLLDVPLASAVLAAAKRESESSLTRSVNAISYDASLLQGAVDSIISKAIAVDPSCRYDSAGDMATQLDAWLEHQPIAGYTRMPVGFINRWISRDPVKTFMASAVLLFLVGISIWIAASNKPPTLQEQTMHSYCQSPNLGIRSNSLP